MKTKKTKIDVEVENCGSIMLFRALTKRARNWLVEHTCQDESQWFGNGLAVELRYAENLANGLLGAGLVVEQTSEGIKS